MIIVSAIGLDVVRNIERMENGVAESTSEKLERERDGKKRD